MQAVKPTPLTQQNVAPPGGGRERRLKCMYTTHLTKKRKTWSDGLLKVYFSAGSYYCSLLDSNKLRETVLVSRQLESIEVQHLKKNEEVELEFENYLVTVSPGESDETKVGPPLKLPKFIPPSRYVPPNRTIESAVSSNNIQPVKPAFFGGPYKVSTEELDEIWDRDEHIPLNTSSSFAPKEMNSAGPPAYMTYSSAPENRSRGNDMSDRRQHNSEASRSSVQATLRQTGQNSNGDALQPALTRYFAPAPSQAGRPSTGYTNGCPPTEGRPSESTASTQQMRDSSGRMQTDVRASVPPREAHIADVPPHGRDTGSAGYSRLGTKQSNGTTESNGTSKSNGTVTRGPQTCQPAPHLQHQPNYNNAHHSMLSMLPPSTATSSTNTNTSINTNINTNNNTNNNTNSSTRVSAGPGTSRPPPTSPSRPATSIQTQVTASTIISSSVWDSD